MLLCIIVKKNDVNKKIMHVQIENGRKVAAVRVKLLLNGYLLTSMATSDDKKKQVIRDQSDFQPSGGGSTVILFIPNGLW